MSPRRVQARWRDMYRVGQRVEVLVSYADGPRWQIGTVCRRTLNGSPVVRVGEVSSVCVDRARDIRAPLGDRS